MTKPVRISFLIVVSLLLMASAPAPSTFRHIYPVSHSTAKATATFSVTVPDMNGIATEFVYPLGKQPHPPKMYDGALHWKIPDWRPNNGVRNI